MVEQLERLVESSGLALGVPIEGRVKSWDSIVAKLERKRLEPKALHEIEDLLGLRVIFLFQRDLDSFHESLGKTFNILSSEDTSARLKDAQFGYKSRHYSVTLPDEWKNVPSLSGLTAQKMEVQVRTLAQHIWAAASHKLQYKHEESVPLPLRRAIYRVSALLETVDLEFERLIDERLNYVGAQAAAAADADKLDVAIVEAVLDEALPSSNKDRTNSEDYSELLEDLQHFHVDTRGQLRALLFENIEAVLAAEAVAVANRSDFDEDDYFRRGEQHSSRRARGVFFTHAGLARQAISEAYGEDNVSSWLSARVGYDAQSFEDLG